MTTRRTILLGVAGLAGLGTAGFALLDQTWGKPPVTLAAAELQAAAGAAPAEAGAASDVFVLGRADAPLTVIEYASLACPHCAQFALSTFPEVKARYIETGKIRYVFRDFPHNLPALYAAMLVRCAGPDRAEGLIDLLFRTQDQWVVAQDPVAAMKQVVKLAGIGEAKADACIADEAIKNQVLQSRFDAEKTYKIESVPSFVIGDVAHAGELDIDAFGEFLKANGLPQT